MSIRPRQHKPTALSSPPTAPHPTVAQWYSNPQLQLLTNSETLGWNTVNLFIERHEVISEKTNIPSWEDDVFGLLLEGSARVHMSLVNSVSFDTHIGPQALQLLPRHSEIEVRSDAALMYAILKLNRQFVTETAADIQYGDPTRIELLPNFFFNDPLLFHLGAELTNEARNANPLGLLYADSLTNTLTLYLLRHYSNGRVVRALPKSRLTPAQLRLVDEYIHAHLEQKIALADLAACLHLSVPHFERMFRTTTQRPPYQYVLELRLDNAKLLLANNHLTIAQVAQQCGFSSQSHFTTHFTRYVGTSPARFARNARQ